MSMSDPNEKAPIIGVGRGLRDVEAAEIQEMILQAQGSDRRLTIPREDLAADATTTMNPAVARVVRESNIRTLMNYFNRDFLYGQGRFDEYSQGMLLKWGDGYSRKHIWITVEGDNLVFETSHERNCGQAFCANGRHVYTPELWRDINVMNAEMAAQFQRPVYERTDD